MRGDEELRRRERAWRESGALEDEAAYVIALERAGLTKPAGLTVAALLGSEAGDMLAPERAPISGADMSDLAGVSAPTLLKWGRTRRCPRWSVKERGVSMRGKFCYDPVEVFAWRRENIRYFEDGNNACHLLTAATQEHSTDAALRVAVAAVWAAVRVGTPTERKRAEELLPKIEAELVMPTRKSVCSLPEGRRMWIDEDTLSPEHTLAYLNHAVECLGHTLPRADVRSLWSQETALIEAVRYAFWAQVCARLDARRGRRDYWDYGEDPVLHKAMQGSFDCLVALAQQDVIPWALGGYDPLAERVDRRDGSAEPVRPEPPKVAERPEPRPRGAPSEKQTQFIARLRVQRGLDDAAYAELLGRWGADDPSELHSREASFVIEHLLRLPKVAGAQAATTAPVAAGAQPAARLSFSGSDKLEFSGSVHAVRPRIRRVDLGNDAKHSYQGYVLELEGKAGEQEGRFAVGVGKAAQAKHSFQAGDQITGKAAPVDPSKGDDADLHKASALKLVEREPAEAGEPPWLGAPDELPDYRARGYVPLEALAEPCLTCVQLCNLPINDAPPRPVCYGPTSCAHHPGA